MATITVRGLDDQVKASIEERARRNGRSMEAEVRTVLEEAVERPPHSVGLGSRIRELFADAGGLELESVDNRRDEKPRAASFE
jgi:plasmid stability protein